MHPVRQVRAGVSARRDASEGLRVGVALHGAPDGFKSAPRQWKGLEQRRQLHLQVAPEDCTGCTLCVEVCPVHDKTDRAHKAVDMAPQAPIRERERENWAFFLSLPEMRRPAAARAVRSSARSCCSRCSSSPARARAAARRRTCRLLTQLFGDRAVIANATGCSSIYGGNLPTTPYTVNREGRGPAWANSLFEDNAEFGLGIRLALDEQAGYAARLWSAARRRSSARRSPAAPATPISRARPGIDGAAARRVAD